jgi:hypothetical protein
MRIEHPPSLEWYALSQAIICFVFGVLILTLWEIGIPVKGGRIKEKRQRDRGMLYLGFAVFVWAFIGIWLLLKPCLEPPGRCFERILSSTLNSAFLLLALAYFEHGPVQWKIVQTNRRWHWGVIVAAVIVASILFLTHTPWADVFLSILTLGFLGWSLFKSFDDRGFYLTSYLSCAVVLFVAFVQLFEIADIIDETLIEHWLGYKRWVFSLASKTSLIGIFLALGFSWLFEDIERPPIMSLEFLGRDEMTGKWIVLFRNQKREISETNQVDLLKFVTKRIDDETDGWIKIKDTLWLTNLNRISKQLGIQRTALFENNGRGSYRLRIDPKNIKIHKGKFVNYPEILKILTV